MVYNKNESFDKTSVGAGNEIKSLSALMNQKINKEI